MPSTTTLPPHCSGQSLVANNGAADEPRPGGIVRADLQRVWHEGGQWFAGFSLGAGSAIARCRPADLRSFARFRKLVMADRGVRILHDSEFEPRHVDQRAAWAECVKAARAAGAAWNDSTLAPDARGAA